MNNGAKIKAIGILFVLSLVFGIILLFSPARAISHSNVDAILAPGTVVNTKMKSLASGAEQRFLTKTSNIKEIRMADSLPNGFVPSDANTVSSPDSDLPIYIFFDNENDAGIMYFYTECNTISMNPYSAYLFAYNEALVDISCVAEWDTSKVANLSCLLCGAKSLPDALALRNWDTSNVTDMSYLFSEAFSLKFVDVSSWNTSNVTNMTCMFQVGNSWSANGQLTEILGLGDLDVSNVTDMTCMFYGAGQMTYYDVSRWDVSKVESMNHMFCDNRSLVSLDLSAWDVSSLKTIYCMFDDNVSLKTIGDVSRWNTASLIDAGSWLNDAFSFVGNNEGALDLSGWNTCNLKSAGEMFLNTKIHTIDLSGWTFESITNDPWEGAGHGIYYEFGNRTEELCGLGQMFRGTKSLTSVYITQTSLDSLNAAIEKGVNIEKMWSGSTVTNGFTVK